MPVYQGRTVHLGEQIRTVVCADRGTVCVVPDVLRVEKPDRESGAHALADLIGGQPGSRAGLGCGMGVPLMTRHRKTRAMMPSVMFL